MRARIMKRLRPEEAMVADFQEALHDPIPMCSECGKTFAKFKALYGHLRLHPGKGYKGANPPPANGNIKKQKIISRSASPEVKNSPLESKGGRKDDCAGEEYLVFIAAEILMSMSKGKHGPDPGERSATDADRYGEASSSAAARGTGKYRCDECDKNFNSHQALGGHRASHNKHKNKADQDSMKIREESTMIAAAQDQIPISFRTPAHFRAGGAVAGHECLECGEVFSSGQALGGHKRAHYVSKASAAAPAAAGMPPAVSTKFQ